MSSQMSIIKRVEGRGLVLPGNDIDTDQIIPARFLRAITFAGLGEQVFRDERFDENGAPRPHPFNDERYHGAEILIVNTNFGCGSSREHAPQALLRFGIKAIVGESFAEIFAGNCAGIGLVVATMARPLVVDLQARVQRDPLLPLLVDIENLLFGCADERFPLAMNEAARAALLGGTWDSLEQLRRDDAAIERVHRRLPPFSTLLNADGQPL
ncbi:3-isopropylmalate dehydratase small subunit [Desulfofustis glycolicus]|uniref:3-isopropylmalate dehydratase n=1 Tax=Desulfofustis glycolicus DSM 9705 TaxID=1121409 RepID=A0A1M5WSH7_9BACT|nr:3-isopropylmalate dehydratase small subunit [Desulfofustis glycolicus]MCB2218327.1 3-isopropylmalate dehydratase small subunit [Desulfobulbaceae bacterium]SHH90074.1 3-isopropylmalate/(R)-2-methylmalate dehydratase small subunit [Desulfofustis glycolicus DSM 9705]